MKLLLKSFDYHMHHLSEDVVDYHFDNRKVQ